jgi:hypothetical protein
MVQHARRQLARRRWLTQNHSSSWRQEHMKVQICHQSTA